MLLYKWFWISFYFSKKLGRSGDGKRNILWGWPFKKLCFDVSLLTSISVTTVVLILGIVEFFKEINLRNILFIGFVKFEIKQWFSAHQDQVCAWFSPAPLPLEADKKLFLYHFLKETALSFVFCFSNLFNASARLFLYLIFCPVT